MIKKVVIATIILIFLIGVVSAAIPDFKTPDGWDNKGNGAYFGPVLGEGLLILEYNTSNVDEYLTQSDVLQITKQNDNTLTFNDTENYQYGVAEVVEINGSKYIVQFWAGDQSNIDTGSLNSVMIEFNKLNNLKPISVD